MQKFLFLFIGIVLGAGTTHLLSGSQAQESIEAPEVIALEEAETQPKIPAHASVENENQTPSNIAAPTPEQILKEKDEKIASLEQKLARFSSSHEKEILAAEADNPEYREKLAAEILELTSSREQIEDAFLTAGSTLYRDESPEVQRFYTEALQKHFAWDDLEKRFLKVYTEVYSAQELSDIASFHRSDVGVAMTKKQPELMQKTMAMIVEINKERLPKLEAEMKAFLEKNKSSSGKGSNAGGGDLQFAE